MTRAIMFAHPACSYHPDAAAGIIYYIPEGRFYKTTQGTMIALPTDGSSMDIPVGLSDTASWPPGYRPDVYKVTGDDHVHFTSGYKDSAYWCREQSDVTSEHYQGPMGWGQDWSCKGGNPFQAFKGLNIPENDAFSTMMVTAPLAKSDNLFGCGSDGFMCRDGKPLLLPTSSMIGPNCMAPTVKGAFDCCQYGVVKEPFPKIPITGKYAVPPVKDSFSAAACGTTNQLAASVAKPFRFWDGGAC
jgi:hypothetical protein